MRKFLLYLFIGSVCASPAFCADGRGSYDSESLRGVSRSVVSGRGNVSESAVISRSASDKKTPVSRSSVVQRVAPQSSQVISRERNNARSVVGRAALNNNPVSASVVSRSAINTDARTIAARAATQTPTADSINQAKEILEQTAMLNKSCQDQYNECMDQFCSVVDTNQKRCSCSGNLSNYSKVEEAVTNANNELNEVAQRIRYIGLSADEIRAIMNATEAEIALDGQKDTSETRDMLSDIESLIKDPSATTSYASTSNFGLDMDLDFTSDNTDMFNLDFLSGTSSNTISNKRGTELYNIAKQRCNTVLNECKKAGATITQITGNYDLAIDKDCIGYEQGLSKMNDTLLSNVRSANLLLQKARLAVLQNKNQYDIKECVSALETCMLDDMVCGENYVKCLDPTKKYIDENGNVILGQDIHQITEFMSNYDNSKIDATYIASATSSACATDGKCIINYLVKKIGSGQSVTSGLCRPVLDKCQRYTYNDETYNPNNDVIVAYIQRAMSNIKGAQSKIISDYASTCMVDIANCYNQQVSQINSWSSSANATSIKSVMTGACRNIALTCAHAVFAYDTQSGCSQNNVSACLEQISDVFYQSLLCPDNSTYQMGGVDAPSPNRTKNGMVNRNCRCNNGYTVWGGACVVSCGANEYRDTYGTCAECPEGTSISTDLAAEEEPASCIKNNN